MTWSKPMMLEPLPLQRLFKEDFLCIRLFQPLPGSRITPSLSFTDVSWADFVFYYLGPIMAAQRIHNEVPFICNLSILG